MSQELILALRKLEYALSQTQSATGEVVQVLKSSSTTTSGRIIPAYKFEFKLEQRLTGEQLDNLNRELWLREGTIRSLLKNTQDEDQYNCLVAELEAIRQQMTETQALLDKDDEDYE